MAHDTPDTTTLPVSQSPVRDLDSDVMQRSWTILDTPASESVLKSSVACGAQGETFAPLTPQKEESKAEKLGDQERHSREGSLKDAVEVEETKKEAAPDDVQHVWHKIMVADAFGLGMHTIINDIVEALTIDVPGSQPNTNKVTAEADGSLTFSTTSRNGKVCIHYKVVDMPGAGDDFDVQKRVKAATDYVAEQNRMFYMKWTTYMRESPEDERVSCVLYFVNPHAIKPVDYEIMAAIGKVAPLVPVIAKGDSMSDAEEQEFRQHVTRGLEDTGITTFSFPALTKELEKAFSLVSSDDDTAENAKRQVKVKRQSSAPSDRIPFHRHPKGDRSLLRSMIIEENVIRLRKIKSQYFTEFVRNLGRSSDTAATERLSRAAVSSLVNTASASGAAPGGDDIVADRDAGADRKRGLRDHVAGRKDDRTKVALAAALVLLVALNLLSIISPVRIGSCCKDLSFSEATGVSLRQALNEQMVHNDKLSKLLTDETLEHKALRQAMEQKVNEMEEMSLRLAAYVRDNSRLAEDNSRLFQNVTALQDKLRSRDGLHVFEFLAMKDWVHNVKGLLGRNFTVPSY